MCSIVCTVDDDVSQCASSAVNGFKAWSDLTCHQRAKVLLKYNKLSFTHIKTFGTECFCNWLNGGDDCVCYSFSANRLVSVLGQHGQCVSELSELCGASCPSSTLVRLLQYYGSWAQLRDTLIANWTPLGELMGPVY